MTRIPAVHLLVEAQQRKIDHPEKIKTVRGNRQLSLPLQHVRAVSGFCRGFHKPTAIVGGEQDQIAFRHRQCAGQRGLLRLVEKLHDGRFPFTAFDLDERETLRAKTLSRARSSFRSGPASPPASPLALSAFTTPPAAIAPLNTLKLLARNSSVKSASSIRKPRGPVCRCRSD